MPENLAVGLGCERGITAASVLEGLRGFLSRRGFGTGDVRRLGTIALKRDEEGLVRAAACLGMAVDYWSADRLASVDGIPNPSRTVRDVVGTPGVAEPAAMLSGSADGLITEKTVLRPRDRRMTLALAALRQPRESAPKGVGS